MAESDWIKKWGIISNAVEQFLNVWIVAGGDDCPWCFGVNLVENEVSDHRQNCPIRRLADAYLEACCA